MSADESNPLSDPEYSALVDRLIESAVERLRAAKSDAQQRGAILDYIERAYAAHLVAEEITDYFCVSNDCIIDHLGLSESDADSLVAVYDQLHDEVIAKRKRS